MQVKQFGHLAVAALVLAAGCDRPAADRATDADPGDSRLISDGNARPPGSIDRARLLEADDAPETWLTSGRDFQFQHYSPLTQINTDTVEDVGLAWEYAIRPYRGRVQHALETTPIFVDGVLYASGPWGSVYAVDGVSGDEIWRFEPEITPGWGRRTCCAPVNRGIAVWESLVYVGTPDGFLVALDAGTGNVTWRVDTLEDRIPFYSITGAPFIAGDNVVIGNSGAEFGVRGYVTAYDTATGEMAWRYYTVPGDPTRDYEHPELAEAAKTWSPDSAWEAGGGGTVWGHMAWDPELNLLYVGTGNGSPWPVWHRSPGGGDNLYLSSILALDPDSGRLVWHYQTTPGDSWDYTATQHMVLAELKIDGQPRRVLMQAPKNGFFYVLDRVNGELLSVEKFVHVNWASHVDLESGRPILTDTADYSKEARIIFPSPFGGHSWMPMAFNPLTGLVYIPVTNAPGLYAPLDRYEHDPAGWNKGLGTASPEIIAEYEKIAAAETRETLVAWDPVLQRAAWTVPRGTGLLHNGGTLATAGNLVIQGTAAGYLNFHDSGTGETLASIEIGTGIMAAPMTYAIDGDQYIAVMAGYGATRAGIFPPSTAPHKYVNTGRLLAFRLGGAEVPLPPALERVPVPPLPPDAEPGTPEQIAEGERLYGRYCIKCHAAFGDDVSAYPKLDQMAPGTHAAFDNIVLKGVLGAAGMASFSDVLTEQQADAIHVYLTSLQSALHSSAESAQPGGD